MMYPLVRELAADGIPVTVTCRVLDIARRAPHRRRHFLCAIKDCFSNRIVGWANDSRMKARTVVAAIEMAVARRRDVAGCILHSDRGSQFRARKAQRAH